MKETKPAPLPEHRIIREKTSREMAFPLGYELLARAFGDLPAWPRCEFWFQAQPAYWASDFARTLAAAEPYPIACVRHRSPSPGFSIYVYPVACALKSSARESFFASAQGAFREFILAESATPNFRDLRAAFFDPVARACTVRNSAE